MIKHLKRLLPVRVKEFKWLLHGDPLPRGWTVGEHTVRGSHHSEYAVLIYRNRWVWE